MGELAGLFDTYGSRARFGLYLAFFLWSLLLMFLCFGRLGYTLRTRDEPSLNGGRPFYDPSVVELLVCSFLGLGFSQLIIRHLWFRNETSRFAKVWFEVGGLAILWLLWLGGAAAASTVWPDLSWCIQYSPCVLLQVLMAWAWLGWITISILLVVTAVLVRTKGISWEAAHHDTWGARAIRQPKADRLPDEATQPRTRRMTGIGFGRAASTSEGKTMDGVGVAV